MKSVLNPDKTVYASHPALQNSKKRKVNFTTNSPTRTFVDYLSNAIRGNSNTEGDSVLSTLGLPGVKPLGPIVQQLRSRKSLAERDLMRQSGRVAGNAFTDVCGFILKFLNNLFNYFTIDYELHKRRPYRSPVSRSI